MEENNDKVMLEENEGVQGNEKTPEISVISFIVSAILMGIGFYKMFAYSNPESSFGTSQNVYVGGDAYNYIINSNYATAYFVLAGVFVLLGGIFIIKNEIALLKKN